jgi:integrase
VTKAQKLTKTMCTSAAPVSAEDGKGRERVLWDAGDGSVKGFGLRVTAKGARSFILMYRAGKGRAAPLRKVTIGPFGSPWTVETARTEAKRLLGEVAAGRDPAGVKAEKRAVQKAGVEAKDSVRAAVKEWIKRDQAGNRTVGEVQRIMDRQVLPVWGDRSLASIRKRDVIELVDGIADRGAKVAANRALAYTKRFLSWCADRDMIDARPAAAVKKVAKETKRDRVLDDAELVEVWRGVEGMIEPFEAGIRLLILTGARRSEIFEAAKAELVAGAIRLPKERAKNDEGRLIHLSPPALAIVEALPEFAGTQWLLTLDGEHPYSNFGYAKEALDRLIHRERRKAAGNDVKPMEPWRFHDLRRGVATGLQRLGVRLEVVEAVLGHTSGSRAGIVGVYQRHQFVDEAREALNLWGEHMARLLAPKPAKVVPMRRRARA